MSFLKVKVKHQSEDGVPGFVGGEDTEIQIAVDKISLFNKIDGVPGVVFVRMACGASLIVCMKYNDFIKQLAEALKSPGKVVK